MRRAQTSGAQDGTAGSTSSTREPLLHEDNVEGVLEDGLTEVQDFQGLLATRPKQVIKWLEENGMEKLGEFEVQDSLFYAAASRESGLVTAGAPDRHLPDYEGFWREHLATCASRSRRMRAAWSETVRVEAWAVVLRNAAAPGNVGIVHPLLRRFQGGAASMIVFGLPAVLATVDFKFEHWGQRLLYAQLGIYNVWLFAFTIFTIIFQDEDVYASLEDLALKPSGQASIALEAVALAAMLPFLYIEVASAIEYGRSWFSIQNIIDACTYVNQVVITVLHLGRVRLDGDLILVLMALQCILLWLRLQFYLKVFRASKFAFVDTLVVVLKDVKWFLVFLLFTMWGFACAFHVLFRTDQHKFEEYSTLWRSLYTMFAAAVSDFDSKTYLQHHNPGVTLPLFVIYLFIVAIILLNLLVALLTNSFHKMTEHAGLRAVISKAQIIDELEDGLPSWAKRLGGTSWYPPYVHVLKVAQSQREELSSAALWTGREDLLDSAEEARMRTRALEAKVDALIAAVDQVLLRAGGGGVGGGGRPPAMRQKLAEAARDDEAATRGVEVSLQMASKGEGTGGTTGGDSIPEQEFDPHELAGSNES